MPRFQLKKEAPVPVSDVGQVAHSALFGSPAAAFPGVAAVASAASADAVAADAAAPAAFDVSEDAPS